MTILDVLLIYLKKENLNCCDVMYAMKHYLLQESEQIINKKFYTITSQSIQFTRLNLTSRLAITWTLLCHY
jgi:hypothetical protein